MIMFLIRRYLVLCCWLLTKIAAANCVSGFSNFLTRQECHINYFMSDFSVFLMLSLSLFSSKLRVLCSLFLGVPGTSEIRGKSFGDNFLPPPLCVF